MKPVVVLGPHRSGTSVTTRIVSLLGPSLCSDLMVKWDNPAGHWESDSLTRLDDELLGLFKGSWYAPPELAPGWERHPDLDAFRRRAVAQFARVHPEADWVWKDPRLCLLLPFWTAALGVDPVVVLTVRHPLESVRSMRARDRWGPAHALAIWEWYVLALLGNCRGRPVVVVRFEKLLQDTYAEVARLRDALEAFGVDVGKGDVAAAARFVDGRLRHHRSSGSGSLNETQARLHRILRELRPGYECFPDLEPPGLTPSTVELIAAHRRIRLLQPDALDGRDRRRAEAARSALSRALEMTSCPTRADLESLRKADVYRRRYLLEIFIARQHQEREEYHLPGFCLLDDEAVNFQLDWLYAPPPVEVPWFSADGKAEKIRIPNWRERMLCPSCGMNNRQRAIAAAILNTLRRRQAELDRIPRVYLTEQVTPMFRYFERLPHAEWIGSEYLGPELAGGAIRGGLRHEDVEALSFEDASMDLVVSCSVIEHVNEPMDAVGEMARILRPGGELFLEVPFDVSKEKNVRRARNVDGKIEHLLAPVYHGDPMSSEGTLVFTDFGWELYDRIRDSGLLTCEMLVYWSLELGHLGGLQFFFHARRTDAPC